MSTIKIAAKTYIFPSVKLKEQAAAYRRVLLRRGAPTFGLSQEPIERDREQHQTRDEYRQSLVNQYLKSSTETSGDKLRVNKNKKVKLERPPQDIDFGELEELIPGITELSKKLDIQNHRDFFARFEEYVELKKHYEELINSFESIDTSILSNPEREIHSRYITEVAIFERSNPTYEYHHPKNELPNILTKEIFQSKYKLNEHEFELLEKLMSSQSTKNSSYKGRLKKYFGENIPDSIFSIIQKTGNLKIHLLDSLRAEYDVYTLDELVKKFPTVEALKENVKKIRYFGNDAFNSLITAMKERGYYQNETLEIAT